MRLYGGEISDVRKFEHVIPILKPGAFPSSPAIYQPVSLTFHIIKTFDRIIKSNLQNNIETYNKISENKNGFRSKRFCISQLLYHHDIILKGLEKVSNVDSVYLEFSNAFDKVKKGILAGKVNTM